MVRRMRRKEEARHLIFVMSLIGQVGELSPRPSNQKYAVTLNAHLSPFLSRCRLAVLQPHRERKSRLVDRLIQYMTALAASPGRQRPFANSLRMRSHWSSVIGVSRASGRDGSVYEPNASKLTRTQRGDVLNHE